jgi:hypothetical protein
MLKQILRWSAKKGFAALALKMPKDDPATLIAIMELVLYMRT